MKIEDIKWLENSEYIKSILQTSYEWEWLPSSRDQIDPFHNSMISNNELINKEEIIKNYKVALKSLREIGSSHPKLLDGPNNYTETFRGAALYTIRKATEETLTKNEGKWTEILNLYINGRWPCGIKENGEIVFL